MDTRREVLKMNWHGPEAMVWWGHLSRNREAPKKVFRSLKIWISPGLALPCFLNAVMLVYFKVCPNFKKLMFHINPQLVGGLVAIFYFPIYWVSNHPTWLSYFSEGWPNHQPDINPQTCSSLGKSFVFKWHLHAFGLKNRRWAACVCLGALGPTALPYMQACVVSCCLSSPDGSRKIREDKLEFINVYIHEILGFWCHQRDKL